MLEAKFRGVAFYVSNLRYGRSVKPKEAVFALSANAAQGTKLDNIDFQIEGFIFGNQAEDTKIKLEQALSKQSGLLVLPDGREVRVKIDEGGWHIIKDNQTIDKYKLDFNFKKINNDNLSLKIIELKELNSDKLKQKIMDAKKSILAEFNEKFQFQGLKGLIKQQSFDNLVSLANKLSKLALDKMIGDVAYPVEGSFDILKATTETIGATLLSYVNLKDIFGGKAKYLPLYLAMSAEGTNALIGDEAVISNNAAAVDLVRQEAFMNALDEALFNTEYINERDVLTTISKIEEAGRGVIYDLKDKFAQNRLCEILTQTVAEIKEKYLIAVKTVRFFESKPAAVIAQGLYGPDDIFNKADDICRRNKVIHPMFVPGGVDLEVCDVSN